MTKDIEITDEDLKKTIVALDAAFQEDLFACEEEDLENYWHFEYNNDRSLVHNLYTFYDRLKLYEGFCRRWEEHTNGSCCVVERVRDKYIISKIADFIEASQ